MKRGIAIGVLLLALTACVPLITPPAAEHPATPSATIQPEANPMVERPQVLDPTVAHAVRDLATQLGVPPPVVTVVAAERVVWPDSALGCPEPGAMYMQALQEGMRIRLQVGEQVYQYHSSATRKPFLCAHPTEPATVSPSTEPTRRSISLSPDKQAIADLATRLNIDENQIDLVRMEEVDWPDGSLGCPQPGMRYKQVVINGVFVQLQVGNQLYNYHGAATQPPFLCTSKDEVLPEDLLP